MQINKIYKNGFTLAEVLSTLAIIGVVTALTIPSLIQNAQNAQTVVGVRKAQTTFSQAYNSFIADGTTMDDVFAGDSQYVSVLNRLITKLSVVKNCGNTPAGCFPSNYKYLDGTSVGFSPGAAAILADGSSIAMNDMAGGCDNHVSVNPLNPFYNCCGAIDIDINGFKGPNQYGRDLFFFRVTRTGIFPYGSNADTLSCNTSS